MDIVLLLARLFLAGVFALSGITKLMDPNGSRKAVAGFGVPERYAMAGGIALPVAEIAIALLLLPVSTAWWGALAALVLLAGFIASIIYNLRRGNTPDCHCFGKIHSEPIGTATLVRDGIFAAVALFIVIFGWDDAGASTIGWFNDLTNFERFLTLAMLLMVAVVGGLAWLQLQMVRQNGRLLLRLDAIDNRLAGVDVPPAAVVTTPQPVVDPGLPLGTPAPSFKLDGIYGEAQTLESLRSAGNPVMLVFSSPTCGPCTALMPDIGRWQRDYGDRLTIAVIGQGEAAANRAKSAEHGLSNVLLQHGNEVSQLYEAKGTPTAVIVATDGTIGSPVAGGAESIRALLSSTVSTLPKRVAPMANVQGTANSGGSSGNGTVHAVEALPVQVVEESEPAPIVNLPDLEGKLVSLEDFAGDPTVVLFWNPTCGFCKRMLPDLKAWEANPPEGAPRLLVVSTGSVEANREQGITSTLVLDETFATGRSFGASGTPSAVLLDGDGLLAGAVAVGAPRVMSMLTGEEPAAEAPPQPSVELHVGDLAPEFSLPDLDGNEVSLSDFSGKPIMVMFWSPSCVFCQRMVDDLQIFESARPANAPELVIVSSGDVEASRAAGLRAPILIDSGFATGRSFGANGTPSGILVDGDGKVAGALTVGGPKILSVLGYVSPTCQECLDNCKQQGGGDACRTVCQMGGQCA